MTLDALGRTVSALDAAGKTTSSAYGLGTANGDSATYATSTGTDANGHVAVSFTDALGRTRYSQSESGKAGGTLVVVEQTAFQYNALNKPTSVTAKDLSPQSGQTITTVTTTEQYDDQGRQTNLNDPDRGIHTYSYDANGNMIADVSGTRTVGYSYDLLGRIGCIQDIVPTFDAYGACTSGANPFVKNTYDADPNGITWSGTNYTIGRLTQSFAINYFPSPDNTQGKVTENMQYDQRGRLVTERLNVTATGGTLAFPTFPQYQKTQTYNDADQPMMTQTTVGGSAGYTVSQAYDSTSGTLTGLSNNSTGVANLATLSYNGQGLISDVNALTTTGSALANEHFTYDPNLRANGTSATWQGGSGSTGTIYSDSRIYDAADNVLSVSATQAAVPGQSGSGGTETQNFCYNEQNRLVWAGNSGTVPAAGNGTCGNGTFQSALGTSYATSFASTYLGQQWQAPLNGGNTQQQYLYCDSTHPHQLTGIYPLGTTCANLSGAVYSSSYDNWGNETSRMFSGTTGALSYDGQDHVVRWNAGATNEEWYAYDGAGQRVLRRTTNSSGTSYIVYAFGVEEHAYDASGTNVGNTSYYTLAERPIGELTNTGTQFFLTDTLGSVVSSFTNISGGAAVKGNQAFGPYGNTRYKQGTMGTARGFTGQYNDSTGLDYYNARYYDPVAGRFLSADIAQGNLSGMNPYEYVGGNPETHNDPTGQCWPWCTALIGAVVGAAIGVGVQAVSNAVQGKSITSGLLEAGVAGGISGAIVGVLGPGAGLAGAIGIGALSGGLGSAAAQVVSNVTSGKSWNSGVLEAGITGAVIGGLTGGLFKAAAPLLMKVGGSAGNALRTIAGRVSLGDLENTGNFRAGALEHIFTGSNGGGYHYEGIPNTPGATVPGTATPPNAFGVYEAKVTINGIDKKGAGGSTFFPKSMSPQDVVDAINEAYNTRTFIKGNTYRGVSSSGMSVQMFLNSADEIISAFPRM